MSWIYLFIASVFEIGWPIGFKMSTISNDKVFWIGFSIVAMIIACSFLYVAQKNIPIGTAYCVWTGIGALGTFLAGALIFHDAVTPMKILAVSMILGGVIILKGGH